MQKGTRKAFIWGKKCPRIRLVFLFLLYLEFHAFGQDSVFIVELNNEVQYSYDPWHELVYANSDSIVKFVLEIEKQKPCILSDLEIDYKSHHFWSSVHLPRSLRYEVFQAISDSIVLTKICRNEVIEFDGVFTAYSDNMLLINSFSVPYIDLSLRELACLRFQDLKQE